MGSFQLHYYSVFVFEDNNERVYDDILSLSFTNHFLFLTAVDEQFYNNNNDVYFQNNRTA